METATTPAHGLEITEIKVTLARGLAHDSCPECGVLVKTRDFADLRRLMKCLNCRLDIATMGQQTGIGHRAILSLVARYGRERVGKEYRYLQDPDRGKGARQPFRKR